jgi:hypothetical protein
MQYRIQNNSLSNPGWYYKWRRAAAVFVCVLWYRNVSSEGAQGRLRLLGYSEGAQGRLGLLGYIEGAQGRLGLVGYSEGDQGGRGL